MFYPSNQLYSCCNSYRPLLLMRKVSPSV